MLRRRSVAVAAAAATLALAGCADPYAQAPDPSSTSTSTPASPNELPAAPDATPVAVEGARTPEEALHDYAAIALNWTWRDLESRQLQLADATVGQAREQAQLLATTAAHDAEMRRGRITHSGTVQSLTPKSGADNVWIVVTHERSGTDNAERFEAIRPSWHVSLATVRSTDTGWVVSAWRPQV